MSRAFWVGIFIAGASLILAGGVFLIGRNEFLFSPRYRLKTEFLNVAGLVRGAEVRIGGVRQGTVGDIALPKRPGGKVIVVVDLKSSYIRSAPLRLRSKRRPPRNPDSSFAVAWCLPGLGRRNSVFIALSGTK